ncbi:hypothetical protein Ciccas_014040, partial [Cichlidogyrus casuarinus]
MNTNSQEFRFNDFFEEAENALICKKCSTKLLGPKKPFNLKRHLKTKHNLNFADSPINKRTKLETDEPQISEFITVHREGSTIQKHSKDLPQE